MRRSLLAISVVLATGGWVCDSADPCPGELTCSNDVAARICCPLESPYRCGNSCSATPACADYDVCTYPDDPGSGLCTAGAYTATIGTITCLAPTEPNGSYSINVSGMLSGCGLTPVSIQLGPDNTTFTSADCGSWSAHESLTSPALECTPGGSVPSGTQWQIHSFIGVIGTSVSQVDVSIVVDLAERPVIAHVTQACPTNP